MRLVKYRGYWYVYVKRGERISLRTKDRAEAEQEFEDFKRRSTIVRTTINDIVSAYLEEKKDKASIRSMMDCWSTKRDKNRPLRVFFRNLRPDHVNRNVCNDFIKKRKSDGVSDGTIRKELGIIRQAIKWNNPAASITIVLPSNPPPKEVYLTKEEYSKLLNLCERRYLKLFVQLALHTAGRKTAILELTWDRVDFVHSKIKLAIGKQTNKGRATIHMNKTLKAALEEARKDASSEFVIEHGGKRISSIDKSFREAVRRAGLKDVTPHTMRHTAAVWMAEAGVPMAEIAQFLGHTNMNTTFRVYARFSPNHLRTASEALEIGVTGGASQTNSKT